MLSYYFGIVQASVRELYKGRETDSDLHVLNIGFVSEITSQLWRVALNTKQLNPIGLGYCLFSQRPEVAPIECIFLID